ncbi:MAG TPA: class I SAM-dependent methyltransferase, partial [Abditibacteriaceae bacterium]
YCVTVPVDLGDIVTEILRRSADEVPEAAHDDEGLQLILSRRKDNLRSYFDELAGRFGRKYVPGRSWKALSETLLKLLPPLVIADLGAGEGTLSLLLAQRAERVIAVDNSEKMVEYGAELASRNAVTNLEYRLGDMEELPIAAGEVDLVLMHQALHHCIHPPRAIEEAARILKPGGRIVILDLLKHDFESARELYADVWLGFSQVELIEFLRSAGFEHIDVSVADRESEAPHFQTVVAIAEKPSVK